MSKFGLLKLVENAENAPDDSTGGGSGGGGSGSGGSGSSANIPLRFGPNEEYLISEGRMCQVKTSRVQGSKEYADVVIILADAVYKIKTELHEISPQGRTIVFLISVVLQCGRVLNDIEVLATEFPDIRNWSLKHFGTLISIPAGHQRDKNLIDAVIQFSRLDGAVPVESTFKTMGWHKIDNQSVYLSGSGAMYPSKLDSTVQVDLGGTGSVLNNYSLEPPLTGETLIEAVDLLLSILTVCPTKPHIGAAVLGFAMRSLFNSMKHNDCGIAIIGVTGSGKTTLAAILLSLWGPSFDADSIPSNFGDSLNALGVKLSLTNDAIHVIDEHTLTGDALHDSTLNKTADGVTRNYLTSGGRDTLDQNRKLRSSPPVRSSLLILGEQPLEGPAIIGRVPHVELTRGDLDFKLISTLQRNGSQLCGAWSSLIQKLSEKYKEIEATFAASVEALRDAAIREGICSSHPRSPQNYANLLHGAEVSLDLFEELEAITPERNREILAQIEHGLLTLFAEQAGYQADNDPVLRFFDMLRAALAGGKAHINDRLNQQQPRVRPHSFGWSLMGGDMYTPNGDLIGWHVPPVDGQPAKIYLHPSNSFRVAQIMAANMKQPAFAGTPATLWRHLMHRNLIEIDSSGDKPRPDPRKSIDGVRLRVVVVDADYLLPPAKIEESALK